MDNEAIYHVVTNQEEQYSIWRTDISDIPAGWIASGPTGTKQECLDYINKTWTDMRPLSLRTAMDEGT